MFDFRDELCNTHGNEKNLSPFDGLKFFGGAHASNRIH
jgi:hypothetical protein